jgi:23S rRNA (adenine2503-C2)-methyltransferase
VETVFIPEVSRGTACLSSQVGCSLSCRFCHTGTMPKSILRNLSSGEILLQLLTIKHHLKDFPLHHEPRVLTNVVMMGMGEPLYNYRNVKKGVPSSFTFPLVLISGS